MKTLISTSSKIVAVALLLLITMNSNAQQRRATMGKQSVASLSNSPAGIKIVDYFLAINEASEPSDTFWTEVIGSKLIEQEGKEAFTKKYINDVRANYGKVDVYVVNRLDRTAFEAYAKGEKGGWLKFEFSNDAAEGYTLMSIEVSNEESAPEGADKPMRIG